ncbi:MAG TPA: sigma-70 family RNA polymerase sigma factor [Planctomycetota bacterium]|nr:sigma-70 family RNA polymerase sigma factor [Planctomycetota bacterium]
MAGVESVQRLFLRHAGPIKGFILGLVPDVNAAEDVFQEVFLTATAKAAEFREGSDFAAWARSIARFKALELYRSGRRTSPLDLSVLVQLAEAAPPPPSEEDWSRHRAALDDCLQAVAPKSRQLVDLRYGQGMLPPEIARRIAWTVSAVHVALSRVRKTLRECAERRLAT